MLVVNHISAVVFCLEILTGIDVFKAG